MNPSPLTVRFGDQTVSLQCDDPELAAFLAEMFQHCLDGRFPPRAAFHIYQLDNGRLAFRRDEEVLCDDHPVTDLLPGLMQELVTALIEAQTEWLIFHAGSVRIDETGVLLGGQTGSGKSTLTACLLANGARYLSDEVVAIDLADPPLMTGLTRPLVLKTALPPTCLPHRSFAFTSSLMVEMADGSCWILPTWLGADVVTEPAPLHLLLFPTYQKGASLTIRPLSPAETAFHLLQNLVNARNLPDKGLPATIHLARRVTAFRIIYDEATSVTAWLHDQLQT